MSLQTQNLNFPVFSSIFPPIKRKTEHTQNPQPQSSKPKRKEQNPRRPTYPKEKRISLAEILVTHMILDLHLGMGLYLSFQPCRATFVARGLGGEDWRAGKREEHEPRRRNRQANHDLHPLVQPDDPRSPVAEWVHHGRYGHVQPLRPEKLKWVFAVVVRTSSISMIAIVVVRVIARVRVLDGED